jgi:hypothetical protein
MTAAACQRVLRSFDAFLTGSLDPNRNASILDHLDGCGRCWARWNQFRWEKAEGHPLLGELRAYLGERGLAFTPLRDSSRELADLWRDHTAAGASRRDFFATSTAYLYNLVIWEASGNRPDYTAHAPALLASHETVTDLGCGIGSDTTALRALGHRVQPVDYLSPSTDFARWRFRQRGHRDDPCIVEPDDPMSRPPAVLWSIDSLDHVPDLHAQLGPLLSAALVVVTENPAVHRAHGDNGYYIRRTADEIDRTFAYYGLNPGPTPAPDSPVRAWMRAPQPSMLTLNAAGSRA